MVLQGSLNWGQKYKFSHTLQYIRVHPHCLYDGDISLSWAYSRTTFSRHVILQKYVVGEYLRHTGPVGTWQENHWSKNLEVAHFVQYSIPRLNS